MNPLLLIGGAVLAVGLVGLIISVLLRPTGSKAHVTVADLQARLAREQSAPSPEADGPVDGQPESGSPNTDAESVDPGREERERSGTEADEPRDAAADSATEDDANQVLLADHRRRNQ
ncbi:hypothetical protein ACIA5H_13005 [Nocardia sp. NPDC051900]|uniref:hypothetical protein n=1 Tax=Nocardia sp. NPDC051900 TaxID=3364326 RepID=UPI00379B3805